MGALTSSTSVTRRWALSGGGGLPPSSTRSPPQPSARCLQPGSRFSEQPGHFRHERKEWKTMAPSSRVIAGLVVAAACTAQLAYGQVPSASSSLEQQVLAARQESARAYQNCDVEGMGKSLTVDYISTTAPGAFTGTKARRQDAGTRVVPERSPGTRTRHRAAAEFRR